MIDLQKNKIHKKNIDTICLRVKSVKNPTFVIKAKISRILTLCLFLSGNPLQIMQITTNKLRKLQKFLETKVRDRLG